MADAENALKDADMLLGELTGAARPPSTAPTMGLLKKVAYTHDAMIDFIIRESAKPGGVSQKEVAQYFGYSESWISNILASDAFQNKLAERKEELVDPELRATIEERFRALTIQSLKVLQQKLNQNTVSDQVALRCAELGAKALGVGGHAAPPPVGASQDRLVRLAERLVSLHEGVKERVINGEVKVLESRPIEE